MSTINRRWARGNKIEVFKGHDAGTKKLRAITHWCKELGVKNLILWVFSTENAKRDEKEVNWLFRIFSNTIKDISKEELEGVKIRFLGNRETFPRKVMEDMEKLEKVTEKNKDLQLIILMGYGGRQEIIHAINRMITESRKGNIKAVNEESFRKYLYAPDVPDPDLVIRTGGEMRLSGIMPWQSVYSELYFSEKLWPDFEKEDLIGALKEYSRRQRRFGK